MKKIRLNSLLFSVLLLTGLYSCSKDDFDPQGGQLPTHYINILDNAFYPSSLTIENGSSVTFLNKTTVDHTIISEDSSTILSPLIAPDKFFFVTPDTISGTAPVVINYHCKEHPTVTGTIILKF